MAENTLENMEATLETTLENIRQVKYFKFLTICFTFISLLILDRYYCWGLPASRPSRAESKDPNPRHRSPENRQISQQIRKHPHTAGRLRLHRPGQKSTALHQRLYREGALQERGNERKDRCLPKVQEQLAARIAKGKKLLRINVATC